MLCQHLYKQLILFLNHWASFLTSAPIDYYGSLLRLPWRYHSWYGVVRLQRSWMETLTELRPWKSLRPGVSKYFLFSSGSVYIAWLFAWGLISMIIQASHCLFSIAIINNDTPRLLLHVFQFLALYGTFHRFLISQKANSII